ncbi:glucose 1-dehydrogenase [Sphingopyxis chilensis]
MAEGTGLRAALVTGASSGIGKAAAASFMRAGYTTILADIDEEVGRSVAAELRSTGVCNFVRCDVSDEADVRGLIDHVVAAHGRLDAAFNNAGIEGRQAAIMDSSADDFDRVVAVNLRGVWLCLREEIRQMLRQSEGGAIVNCSSVAGLIGLPGMSPYVASKHGVIGLTRAAALECAQSRIRVNAVCPGAIQTPMLDRYMAGIEGGRAQMEANEPMGRIGGPEEIASAVLWLCGKEASFVTGHALAVDGGWTAA